MKIDLIAGARPNFMKIAPIIDSINSINVKKIKYRLIHTGQHYDQNMSDSFFDQLQIPYPDINLESGGGTQAEQTSKIMVAYESLLMVSKPDICLVVGDVTSTMACAIVAKKMDIKVAHVEAGIRSWDLSMPEEINRMVTDSITDYFFTTTETANKNLYNVGISKDKIFYVGNTMIDTLLKHRQNFVKPSLWNKIKLKEKKYIILTLHRPSNVDKKNKLKVLIETVLENARGLPVIFPVHPRTKQQVQELNISNKNLFTTEPLGYLEFNYLVDKAKLVLTDSGGITEETTVMNIPCMTLRDSTERPETVYLGTNELIGTSPKAIKPAMKKLFLGEWKKGIAPPLWDGKTADRIVNCLLKL